MSEKILSNLKNSREFINRLHFVLISIAILTILSAVILPYVHINHKSVVTATVTNSSSAGDLSVGISEPQGALTVNGSSPTTKLCIVGETNCPTPQSITPSSATPVSPTPSSSSTIAPSVTSGIDCPVLNPADFSTCSQWCTYQQSLPAIYSQDDAQAVSQDASDIASYDSTLYSTYVSNPTAISLQTVVNDDNEFINITNQGLTKNYNIELGVHEKAASYGCYTTAPTSPTLFPLVNIDDVSQ